MKDMHPILHLNNFYSKNPHIPQNKRPDFIIRKPAIDIEVKCYTLHNDGCYHFRYGEYKKLEAYATFTSVPVAICFYEKEADRPKDNTEPGFIKIGDIMKIIKEDDAKPKKRIYYDKKTKYLAIDKGTLVHGIDDFLKDL